MLIFEEFVRNSGETKRFFCTQPSSTAHHGVMADLDDFFAKKDKKKSKAKPKFLTADELVKNLEDTKKEAASKPKKSEPATAPDNSGANPAAGDDGDTVKSAPVEQPPVQEEEWKEFEEEQQKDYSGLKIGHMTINDEEDQSPNEGEEEELDSDGNTIPDSGKGGSGGPWKKVVPAEEVMQIPMEVQKEKKVYISPGLRNSHGVLAPVKLKSRNRTAPDITNADYFPTLGAARPEEQRKKKNEPAFEEVRHGGRVQRVHQESTAAPSSATNRFQSLDEDDS